MRATCALTLLALAISLGACTSRTLRIATVPEGADAYLNERYVGQTPVTVDFRYGGMNELILIKPEYRSTVVRYDSERLEYDVFPFDFFTDLGPWEAIDRQQVTVTLQPSDLRERFEEDPESVLEGLRQRADVLRERSRRAQVEAPPRAPLLPGGTSGGDGPAASPAGDGSGER